ncbi:MULTISPECIES: 1-acyl-sn-glycerol-3-phosphate acyltransferase [unclassified Isoptericola]|uniref:1-acyl-sn-glycerol-3-phosphate acyltransferase n=1 Tax=unclassified Isoptericola TaxID=2623355 RepID=UPI002712FE24|nr:MULTISPECIES: 1-acyl-sn-glycerol-3-phosphate acyltransferase [unclassified Isoptericola]MDO8144086.1 1-acyl-sn-glycerol-3-phosphate acyltransferase [Isoptericola sp. 178]MDO8149499.1 1-acyl-sn-glycerol-3-phosphate acyltransferase [Isoptericola sp. b515]MDO8152662.1 1-acyl-sn-glycerol-3-phosphate acyltransferase [Isoptericola sp. b408]
MLPPRWVRRVVLAPLVVALAVVMVPTTLMFAVLVGGVLTWVVPGGLRVLRLLWMTAFYIVWDATALLAMFGLWLAAGCGLFADRPWYRRAHVRLARGMLALFFWQVRWTLRLRIELDVPDALSLPEAPLVVLSRHAGPGDSFIIVDRLLGLSGRAPAIVLKDTMQWDPAIDVLMNRLPAAFVTPASRRPAGRPGARETVHRIAAGLTAADALVLFPEGGNVTPRRRAARIEALRRSGHEDLARRAEAMHEVMAPHVGGFDAALEGAPEAAVLVVAHTGLDRLVDVRDVWRELPMDKTVTMRAWLHPPGAVPRDVAAREAWLFDQWQVLDDWIAAHAPAD